MQHLPKNIFNVLSWVFHSGVKPGMEPEEEEAMNRSNLFYFLVFILGAILLEESIRVHAYMIPVALTIIAGGGGAFVIVARTGRPFFPSLLLLGGLSLLFLAFTATGGPTGTAFIWLCVFPFLFFLAFPFRVSIIFFSLLLIALGVIFFIPGDPFLSVDYAPILRQRIFIAYVFAGCAALASEFIRWEGQQRIDALLNELRHASQTDMLTGLFNRRVYLERLAYEISRSKRENQPLCLVMFDIDHFKNINDTYGHNCGDEALRHLAEVVQPLIRRQDTLARWGGEEFLVLLPGTDAAGGMILAEKIRAAVEGARCPCDDGTTFSFTVSLGVHQCDPNETNEVNISKVDANLYRAKEQGRNRVCGAVHVSWPLKR